MVYLVRSFSLLHASTLEKLKQKGSNSLILTPFQRSPLDQHFSKTLAELFQWMETGMLVRNEKVTLLPSSLPAVPKKKTPLKRASRAANIETVCKAIEQLIRDRSEEADSQFQSLGTIPEYPEITQKLICQVTGLSKSILSRVINDSSASKLHALILKASHRGWMKSVIRQHHVDESQLD